MLLLLMLLLLMLAPAAPLTAAAAAAPAAAAPAPAPAGGFPKAMKYFASNASADRPLQAGLPSTPTQSGEG